MGAPIFAQDLRGFCSLGSHFRLFKYENEVYLRLIMFTPGR